MGCRDGFPAEAVQHWVEREDLEGRGQDHGYWCAAQRRPEDREHHQAGGGERSGAHPGSRRVRSGSGEAKGIVSFVLATDEFLPGEAEFGSGEMLVRSEEHTSELQS